MNILIFLLLTTVSLFSFAQTECVTPDIFVYRQSATARVWEKNCEEVPERVKIKAVDPLFPVCQKTKGSFERCQYLKIEQIEELNKSAPRKKEEPTDSSQTNQCSQQPVSRQDAKQIASAVVESLKHNFLSALYFYRYELFGAAVTMSTIMFLKYLYCLGVDTQTEMASMSVRKHV